MQSDVSGFYIQVDSLVHLLHLHFAHFFVLVFTKTSTNFFPVLLFIIFFKNILSWGIFDGFPRDWVILNRIVKLSEDGPDITSIHIEAAKGKEQYDKIKHPQQDIIPGLRSLYLNRTVELIADIKLIPDLDLPTEIIVIDYSMDIPFKKSIILYL